MSRVEISSALLYAPNLSPRNHIFFSLTHLSGEVCISGWHICQKQFKFALLLGNKDHRKCDIDAFRCICELSASPYAHVHLAGTCSCAVAELSAVLAICLKDEMIKAVKVNIGGHAKLKRNNFTQLEMWWLLVYCKLVIKPQQCHIMVSPAAGNTVAQNKWQQCQVRRALDSALLTHRLT